MSEDENDLPYEHRLRPKGPNPVLRAILILVGGVCGFYGSALIAILASMFVGSLRVGPTAEAVVATATGVAIAATSLKAIRRLRRDEHSSALLLGLLGGVCLSGLLGGLCGGLALMGSK